MITVVIILGNLNSSIKKLTTTSIRETEEVSAATKSRKKKRIPNSCPPLICEKTAGMVINVRPGPAEGLKPKTKIAGKTINPDRKQISVVNPMTLPAELGIEVSPEA